MTQIDSLLPTLSNDTHTSHSDPEDEVRGRVDDIVVSEGHQQLGLAADGNFHSAKSNVTFNTTQENGASNTNADIKHPAPSTKALMSLRAPSGIPGEPETPISNTGGPSTPTVKKASVYNVLLINALNNNYLRLSIPERSVLVLSSQLLPSQLLVLLVPKSPPLPLCRRQLPPP
jgi:hypothetical protein